MEWRTNERAQTISSARTVLLSIETRPYTPDGERSSVSRRRHVMRVADGKELSEPPSVF